MARCKVCAHSKVREINRLLLTGTSCVKVAKAAGICRPTMWHHRQTCLPWRPERRPKPVTVAEKLADLEFELSRLQVLGECDQPVSGAIAAVNARRSLLELEARLEGKLDATHRKLLSATAPEGDYEVVFTNGRPRTVAIEKA